MVHFEGVKLEKHFPVGSSYRHPPYFYMQLFSSFLESELRAFIATMFYYVAMKASSNMVATIRGRVAETKEEHELLLEAFEKEAETVLVALDKELATTSSRFSEATLLKEKLEELRAGARLTVTNFGATHALLESHLALFENHHVETVHWKFYAKLLEKRNRHYLEPSSKAMEEFVELAKELRGLMVDDPQTYSIEFFRALEAKEAHVLSASILEEMSS